MNDKQNNLTHKKVKTKMSVDIMHKMREIVNLAKLMRHFWAYEPFNTWSPGNLVPIFLREKPWGRGWSPGIQSPLSVPRCLDVPWETRLLACSRFRDGRVRGIEKAWRRKNGRKLFSAPPSFSRAFPSTWGPGTGYPAATWNATAVTWETTSGSWVCRLQQLLLKHV